MELKASALQSCINCLNNKHLRSGIYFEDKRGYPNAFVRKMRFNCFLLSKLSKLHSRSKHNYVQNLLEEFDCYDAANISDRPKMLNKVPTLMGCINMEYLIEGEKSLRASDLDPKDTLDEFEISLAYRRFPSIIVGSSSPVELYDETACDCETSSPFASHNCNRYAPNSMGRKWINPDTETWHLLDPCQQLDSSLISKESSSVSPLFCQSIASEKEQKSDSSATMEESCINVPRSRQNTVPVELILDKSVSSIPGLSRRHCNKLEDCGFHTIRKLLHHFPRTYADLQNAQGGIDDGNYLIFVGKILSSRGIRTSYSFSFLEVVVACEIGHGDTVFEPESVDNGTMEKKIIYFHLKKFFRGTRFTNQFFLRSLLEKHKEGDLVCVSGKVRTLNKKDHYEMREYNIDVLDDEKESSARAAGKPYPLYPSKGGLDPNFLRDIISRALQALSEDIDPVPKEMREEFGLPSLYEAYMGIHGPKDLNEADLSRRRLIFDEFFYLQLARLFQMLEGLGTRIEKDGLLNKYKKDDVNTVLIEEWSSITKKFLKALPYVLTPSQLSAVSEIIWDLKRPVPMNRLLQGDVGCGKTVVAFLACMEVIGSGYQAAFMVPTELLAVQHYEHFLELLENMEEERKPLVALLTGSTPSKQSRVIRKGLQTGDISLVIGTHSLISESIEFSALRIAVVDEQHRFGVIQRGTFNNKLYSALTNSSLTSANSDASSKSDIYMAPHVLAMSATPIPRSLALALYGDMSLTQITDLPPGRIPVETYTLEGNEIGFENVYQMMKDELLAGGKIYLVYPVIEQSEQLPQLRAASADLKTISSKFPGHCCGLLHGKMKSDEKDEALKRFRSGETHILLSTQVIEIGVDVPDASMMVVMNAERFGIAQLHQLRGRVGRGTRKSRCIFLSSIGSNLNRLKVLEKSSDGFHLANVDLLLRGPGDLLGKKQSGHLPEFPIARLDIDGNILQEAHLVALKILGSSQDLECFPRLKAELSMRQPLCLLGD